MKNKLKILWFGLVPLGWFLAFRFIIWINNYPIDWDRPSIIGMFLLLSGFLGTIFLILGSIILAFSLQD